jgi:hypothetical protein
MEKVTVSMEVPKEGKEVVDALAAIVAHFKSGKGVNEAAVLLPGVMSAVDGVGKVAEELKSDGKDELAGYLVHKVMAALAVEPPAPAAE